MWERNMDRLHLAHPQLGTWPATWSCALTGNWTSYLSVCRVALSPLNHTSQGLVSHFECDGHTVHMLIQWRLLPPLTRTVRLSLFTYAHSSPLSLAARLDRCCTNCSLYVNNAWTISGQTPYNQLIFDYNIEPRILNGESIVSSLNGIEKLGNRMQKSEIEPLFHITHKNELKMG